MSLFQGKVVVITGGTGSLGQVLTRRLLEYPGETPRKIIIFSRDEAKQHQMRITYQQKVKPTDEVIYHNFERLIEFRIGDIRDYSAVRSVLQKADIVINAAALKQVPSCEYFPFEAVQTNIIGAENIVRAIREAGLQVETVVGVSTDKACKPVNTMGMTKAIQERIWIAANINAPHTRFICDRYGNVLASRGSVIPLFHEEIRNGGPLTVTTPEMTRFLLPLERAVDTIFAALAEARPGEIYIPRIASARITELAKVLMADRRLPLIYTGIRPGEKVHEILVSEEEAGRTFERGRYLAIQPMLPEVTATDFNVVPLGKAYSSADVLMSPETIRSLLVEQHLMVDQIESEGIEVLR